MTDSTQTRELLRERLIESVTASTQSVFGTMVFIEAQPGDPRDRDAIDLGPCITGLVGFTGDAIGSIAAHFEPEIALTIVSTMLGEDLPELNGEARDGVGEIANMIIGEAKAVLESEGILLAISIPNVISGENYRLGTKEVTRTLIPFLSPAGTFMVEVALAH